MKVKKIKYLKYLEKRKLYFIEKKYQYIDKEICDKYKNANKSNFYELKKEIKNKYGLYDIEAINILMGHEDLIYLYVKLYKNIEEFDLSTFKKEEQEEEEEESYYQYNLFVDYEEKIVDEDIKSYKDAFKEIIDDYSFEENDIEELD